MKLFSASYLRSLACRPSLLVRATAKNDAPSLARVLMEGPRRCFASIAPCSRNPHVDYSQIYQEEKHWKIDDETYLSILGDFQDYTNSVEMTRPHDDMIMVMKIGSDSKEISGFFSNVKDCVEGTETKYTFPGDPDEPGTTIEISKTGIIHVFEEYRTRDELLSEKGMKELVALQPQVEETAEEWMPLLRDAALDECSCHPYSGAIEDYEEFGSYEAFERVEEMWHHDSRIEVLSERFGFTDEERYEREREIEQERSLY